MDWAVPGCLGSLGYFKNKFSDPIEQGQRHSATKRALATGRKTVRALVRRISHWFLRRTKALIKEQLPKKDDRMVYCSLTDFQQTVYQAVLDTEDVTLLLRSSEKCDCQSGRIRRSCCYKMNSEGVQIKDLYFSYLTILRKVANHVALLQSTTGTSKKQEKYVSAICQNVFQNFPDFVRRCKYEAFEALSDPVYSGKMKVLQKLLKYYLQKRDKVLLFSLSTKLLDVLENYCMAEGLDYSRLDGNTKSKDRIQIVKEFNSSTHINLCLVSTMAGGLGLNFVGANVVVLFDPTWNPASDLQAIDRAYRIGQSRDVTVLRLISLGTVEEVIYLRQVYKQQLQCSVVGKESARRYFEAVQGHGRHGIHKGELFGIKNLFRLQTQGTCLTRQILEREGQVEAGVMTTRTHAGKEEEERKRISECGNSSPMDGPIPKNAPAKENRNALEIPRGVLDFSSGSEEDEEQRFKRKDSKPSAVDGNRTGNAATALGQMSLLQHGFSRLLERVKGTPDLRDGDSSPDVEENPSDTDDEVQEDLGKREGTSSVSSKTGNSAICIPTFGTKSWDISCGSEGEDGGNRGWHRQDKVSRLKKSNDAIIKRQDLNRWTNKKITDDQESDEHSSPDKKPDKLKTMVPTADCFEGCSEESEDFDLDATTWSKQGAGCNKRKRYNVKNMAKTKYTEDIETFTSSDDEHTLVKKKRSSLTKRSRVDMSKDVKRATTARRERDTRTPTAVSFTNLKSQTFPASKGKDGTIDSVLGGVPGVAHTHSNQRVVGGSKAEELISRAAVRDVYERKMNSQLPANHLLGTQESLSLSPPDSQPCPAVVRLNMPTVVYPVTFTSRSVHHTRHTTFIVGETPQAIRRQQLEEMAEKFKFLSVSQFAAEVLRRNSSQRLAFLREYYTSLNHPDLTNTVTNNFPQPDSVQTSSSSTVAPSTSTETAAAKSHVDSRTLQKDVPKATKKTKYSQKKQKQNTKQNSVSVKQKKSKMPQNDFPECQTKVRNTEDDAPEPWKMQKISQKNVLDLLSDIPSPVSEDEEEFSNARGHKRTKTVSVSSSGAYRAGGGLGMDHANSSGLGSGEAVAFVNRIDRDIPSFPDLSHGRSTTLSKPAAQGREQEQKSPSRTSENLQGQAENSQTPFPSEVTPFNSNNHPFLTDLIGDTSILDDLLKPKSRGAKQKSTPKTPSLSSSVMVNTSLTTASPPKITCHTETGSPWLFDSLSSPSSQPQTTLQSSTPLQPSKTNRKDFWDILNEGNDESINRLTDPAEVQRVCFNSNFLARSRSEEKQSKSLWKANEKFLWKK
ncbi:DNA excision repair protein ERCC-6-like 2 isoform X2 [Mastacembelus armatus]|nr:DNA excision repair protein ERCC-6-like 2 isoform X2 [Mastacembelus armatus]